MSYNHLLDATGTPLNIENIPDFRNEGQKLNSEAIKQIIRETQYLAVI